MVFERTADCVSSEQAEWADREQIGLFDRQEGQGPVSSNCDSEEQLLHTHTIKFVLDLREVDLL